MSSSPERPNGPMPSPESGVPEFVAEFTRIAAHLRSYMEVREARVTDAGATVTGTVHEPLAENLSLIRDYVANQGYATLFGWNQGDPALGLHTIRFGIPATAPGRKSRLGINILLFILTLFSTLFVGALQQGGDVFFLRSLTNHVIAPPDFWPLLVRSLLSANPLGLRDIGLGIPFAFALILILGSHELGHYLTARRYGVDATLPFFIPMPFSPLGTMGAFIRIKSPIPNRQALIRLGVAGPLVGFLVALPLAAIGIKLSQPVLLSTATDRMPLGSSLLFEFLSRSFFPNLAPGYEVSLHPLAFAGWLGFFVTALNLIPIGQLDGGHIAYVALGRYRRLFRVVVLAALVGLGFIWPGWFFWGILAVVLGLGHPATQDELTPLGTADRLLIAAAILVFALTFMPNPFPAVGR